MNPSAFTPAIGIRRVAAVACVLTLAGCASLPGAGPSTAPSSSSTPLEGTPWSLVALGGTQLPAMPLARVPLLELKDGRVAGTSGCNRLTGPYTLAGVDLRFGPTAGTRMMCPDGMDLERDVLAMLGKVTGWRVREGRLELLDAGGAELARLASNLRSYACGEQGSILVRYEGEGTGARATLSLGGREYSMHAAPTGSGARYVVEQGRQRDMSMEWRTKGDEGVLLEAPLSDSRRPDDLKPFAQCRAR